MERSKCGRCTAVHGPYETCFIPSGHPYYYFSAEWVTGHPREGGKWEMCWVVPLSSKPRYDIPDHDTALLSRYFTIVWDSRYTGGGDKPPCKSRTNCQVMCGKTVTWTVVYRWAPDYLDEARRLKGWLAEEQERRLGPRRAVTMR